jgi:hypothetical protein
MMGRYSRIIRAAFEVDVGFAADVDGAAGEAGLTECEAYVLRRLLGQVLRCGRCERRLAEGQLRSEDHRRVDPHDGVPGDGTGSKTGGEDADRLRDYTVADGVMNG